MPPERAAVVLAGGGAMGAYEAGVMRYVLSGLSDEGGPQGRFSIFSGTSVGALSACFLAAHAHDPHQAGREIATYWDAMCFEEIFRFRLRELAGLPRLVAGSGRARDAVGRLLRRAPPGLHRPVEGVFDTEPLRANLEARLPWDRLQANIASGVVQGVALGATEVCSGFSTIFYQLAPGAPLKPSRDPAKQYRPVRLGVDHAMASSAMPFLFPSIQVDGVCYTDGSLRQNTPLSPALRMEADRALVVSLTQDPAVASRRARAGCRRNAYPGAPFLLGRTAYVVMSQQLDYELKRVQGWNHLIRGGTEELGEEFIPALNKIMGPVRNAHYRPIDIVHVCPSRSLHEVALEALEEAPDEVAIPGATGRLVSRILTTEAARDSELIGLILFTPTYARKLLALGEADARAQRHELVQLFS